MATIYWGACWDHCLLSKGAPGAQAHTHRRQCHMPQANNRVANEETKAPSSKAPTPGRRAPSREEHRLGTCCIPGPFHPSPLWPHRASPCLPRALRLFGDGKLGSEVTSLVSGSEWPVRIGTRMATLRTQHGFVRCNKGRQGSTKALTFSSSPRWAP